MSDKKLWDQYVAMEKERDALRAKVEQMEKQEPVAWYSKQYGFVYMSRQPSQFEHGSILYLRNGAPAWRIEGSSKVALLDIASLPHGTVFYAIPGAQPAPSESEARMRWLLRQIVHALPSRRDWLDPAIEREARIATTPEANHDPR